MRKLIRALMPHVAIIISGMYLVFYCIDFVNTAMAFINHDITKGLLVVMSVITIANACAMIFEGMMNRLFPNMVTILASVFFAGGFCVSLLGGTAAVFDSRAVKTALLLLCICSTVNSLIMIAKDRRDERERVRKLAERRRKAREEAAQPQTAVRTSVAQRTYRY